MRIRRRMSQTQPDLGGARYESSSRPSGHGGVNTSGTHLVTSDLASLPEPEGRLRHSQPWLCRDLALIGERALLGVKGPNRSEIRNPVGQAAEGRPGERGFSVLSIFYVVSLR